MSAKFWILGSARASCAVCDALVADFPLLFGPFGEAPNGAREGACDPRI
jgi:hypothetical protein